MTSYSEYDPDHRAPDPDADDNRNAIIAGVITALVSLAVLGFFILRNQPDPVAAPTTTQRTSVTTQAPDTTGGTDIAAGYTPLFTSARCEFDLITDAEHECGWLTVPEDRQDPGNGREVQLHVVRFASTAADAPADPVIYLDGGPGGSTLDPLQFSFGQRWEPLLDDRDLIMFDQRGVGLSLPSLDCPEERKYSLSVLDQDLDSERAQAAELAVISQCHDRLVAEGIDLAQYNSQENAADVADLRVALGIDEWNLLGISYGTRLAETIMRDHPEGVRSVILDSTYTPDVDLFAEGPANFSRALAKLWEGCRLDSDCATRYSNLEDRFFALVDRYEATPTRVPVRDFLNGGSRDVLIDGEWILGTVFQGLYSEQVIPLLPQMIEELENNETSTISLLTSNVLANVEFISVGMNLSVQCNEELPFTTQDDIDEGLTGLERLMDPFEGEFTLETCAAWKSGMAAPLENEPVSSDIPTLVMAGEYDPITPPSWGANAATFLTNSTFVEFTGLGHGTSIAGDCPLSIVFEFLADPTAVPDLDCTVTMAPVDFAIPGEPPPPIQLVSFTEDFVGTEISGVVPAGWEPVGGTAFARGDSAIDQTAIIFQVVPLISPESVVSFFATQFEMDAEPERTSTQESPLGVWQVFRGDADEFSIDIAAIDLGGSTAVIVLISNPGEREQLLGDLLLPAIQAFRTS